MLELHKNYGAGYGIPSVDAARSHDMMDRANRFATYLNAHGYPALRGALARHGISVAVGKGEDDENACNRVVLESIKRCDRENVLDCIEQGELSDRSCRRVASCDKKNNFPF